MTTQRHHHDKVKVVIDCSIEERAYIKMLAARKHMTISEYFLALAKEESRTKAKTPNETTLAAHQEALNEGGTEYLSMDDFWKDMGVSEKVPRENWLTF